MTNFVEELAAAAHDAAERPAVRLDDHTLSYGQLDASVARAAGLLKGRGVDVGARVGMQLPNVPYFPIVYYAVLRLGAVVVPMNPLLKSAEVEYHLSDAGVRVMLGWDGFEQEARAGSEAAGAECIIVKPGEFDALLGEAEPVLQVAERADDDPAVIIYTSGTTRHAEGRRADPCQSARRSGSGARPGRRRAGVGGPGHAPAVPRVRDELGHEYGASRPRPAHARPSLRSDEGPRSSRVRSRDDVRRVPTMYAALLNHPDRERYDISSVNLCVSGGSAMPVEVLRGFDEAFGATVLEGYGLSETTGMGSFNLRDRERKPGSIGVPVGGTEMKAVDDDDNEVPRGEPGEIVMRGPFVMRGYWNRDDATAEVMRNGWFHTGDVATVDEDGYFFIVDRKKDLIIRGGYNVYPREIEEVLYTHSSVLEAAVIGVAHDSLGEEVGAAVVLKEGEQATPDDLREHAKGKLAAYKYPRAIWLLDELPKGPTGKILKREIEAPEGLVLQAPS